MQLVNWERQLRTINGTFYFAIPKEWISANHLEPKSEITIILNEKGELTVKPSQRELELQKRIGVIL